MWVQEQEIKHKIVDEYKRMVREYNVGHTYDYNHILNMINFLDIAEYTTNPKIITSYFLHK